jgi:tRNA modification GTPase
MSCHLHNYNRGQLVRDGLKVAIVGPSNARKSSLLNVLAQREVAIVSPIASPIVGTTQDINEVVLDLGSVHCIVSDTAGMRAEGGDMIEIEGMAHVHKAAQNKTLSFSSFSSPTPPV